MDNKKLLYVCWKSENNFPKQFQNECEDLGLNEMHFTAINPNHSSFIREFQQSDIIVANPPEQKLKSVLGMSMLFNKTFVFLSTGNFHKNKHIKESIELGLLRIIDDKWITNIFPTGATKNNNVGFHKAKKNKHDEYYTRMVDIKNELRHYYDETKNKRIFLNCDTSDSNFVKYFREIWNLQCHGFPVIIWSDKDFRSARSLEVLQRSEIVVTNPPFSLMGQFLDELMNRNKDFIIIAPITATYRKSVFPHIMSGRIKVRSFVGNAHFHTPEKTTARIANAVWLTTLNPTRNPDCYVRPNPTIKYNPNIHKEMDNYYAINVDHVKNIPTDYIGVMGVPIWWLNAKYKTDLFDIVGICNKWGGLKYRKPDAKSCNAVVDGKEKYVRILIKWKNQNRGNGKLENNKDTK